VLICFGWTPSFLTYVGEVGSRARPNTKRETKIDCECCFKVENRSRSRKYNQPIFHREAPHVHWIYNPFIVSYLSEHPPRNLTLSTSLRRPKKTRDSVSGKPAFSDHRSRRLICPSSTIEGSRNTDAKFSCLEDRRYESDYL
jgi:hypothetical protein